MKFVNHLGLDIGTRNIKLVQLSPIAPDKFRLAAFGQIATPTAENQLRANQAKAEAIRQLVKNSRAGSRQAAISLPESQVFTRVVELPQLSDEELSQAIKWQAEQYIPVPLADMILKHQVLTPVEKSDGQAKTNVLLVAAPRQVLADYTTLLSQAGLEPIAIETEILAVARALVGTDVYSPTTLLVHLGAENTTFSVLSRGDLALTQAIGSGGTAIARSVAAQLGLDYNQAEEYQRSYGLDETKLEGKVVAAIKPIVDLILAEAKRVLAYYETRAEKQPVKRVVLSGGTAQLPGLVTYLTRNLGLEAQIGNPFLNIELSEQQKQDLGENGSLYATAVGLALKLT